MDRRAFVSGPPFAALERLGFYCDGDAYEIRDTLAVITGKLGTGSWRRSVE